MILSSFFAKTGIILDIDPDKLDLNSSLHYLTELNKTVFKGIFLGSSTIVNSNIDTVAQHIKSKTDLPLITFPGAASHITSYVDGLMFMSMLSSRNPEYLIGEQVKAAPMVYRLNIPSIAVAYLLVESGTMTTVEFVSNSKPLPRNKPALAIAHGLAAKYLGMQVIYLDAGSGAELSVPLEMVGLIHQHVDLPVIVGGGIRSPEAIRQYFEAGATSVVIGDIVEKNPEILQEFNAVALPKTK